MQAKSLSIVANAFIPAIVQPSLNDVFISARRAHGVGGRLSGAYRDGLKVLTYILLKCFRRQRGIYHDDIGQQNDGTCRRPILII